MTSVGLMMIVKDEAHVIERCLTSTLPAIDWWVVVDTGSTDGTQGVVRRLLADVPGELVERPWVSFGHNRQEALDLARASAHRRGTGDYALWIDADEQLVGTLDTTSLTLDGYSVVVHYGTTRYARLALVRLDSPWRWVGPVHEYLSLDGGTTGALASPTVLVTHDGARAKDPGTYLRDAALIEAALAQDPEDPRLQFYLAQSLRDAGDLDRARVAYAVRAGNPRGWDQERFYALFQLARILERLGRGEAEVVDAYLRAYDACPWRAETLVELARYERGRERYAVALHHALRAAELPMPGGEALFVDADSYEWRGWDEIAVSAYWLGRYDQAEQAARRAVAHRPDDPRLQENLAWCLSRQGHP